MRITNRPSMYETMMEVAYSMAARSTCPRRHNGAVISTHKGVVLSTGYNGSLSGMPHCDHDSSEVGCTTAVHAEANSIYFAARHGVRVEGTIIFCTTEPCVKCAEAIIQSGITHCIYDQEYRSHDGLTLLRNAGIVVKTLAQ